MRHNGRNVGTDKRCDCLPRPVEFRIRHDATAIDSASTGVYFGLGALNAATTALFAGLAGYLVSVFCWHKTLHTLALSKAYALLSLSYVLVWVASMLLPGLQGAFSLKAMLGVLCIMAG